MQWEPSVVIAASVTPCWLPVPPAAADVRGVLDGIALGQARGVLALDDRGLALDVQTHTSHALTRQRQQQPTPPPQPHPQHWHDLPYSTAPNALLFAGLRERRGGFPPPNVAMAFQDHGSATGTEAGGF